MAYATIAKIKERCRITTTDTTYDVELANAVIYGDKFVSLSLVKHGLSPANDTVLAAEAGSDYGAYYFLRNRGQSEASAIYRANAIEMLSMYVFANTGQVLNTGGPPIPEVE